MEENLPEETLPQQPASQTPSVQPAKKHKRHLPEVIAVRDWKEYLGESVLIIFSVTLALILTEVFTSLHEKQQAKEVLHQLKEELINNKKAAELQYAYDTQIFSNIDSAVNNVAFGRKFLDSGKIHLTVIIPHGVMLKDLNDVAWQVAKQNNVFSKIDFATYSLLTDIYDNQERIKNLEGDLSKILLSYESRKQENLRTTLILIHDAFYAWMVERTPNLLQLYQRAIDRLGED